MKSFIKSLFLGLALTAGLYGAVNAQVAEVELTIQNQTRVGNSVEFDVYLRTLNGFEYYFGSSDMVLTFNGVNFTNPTFSKVDGGNTTSGFCNLVPFNSNPTNDAYVNQYYFQQTSVEIVDGELVINVPEALADASNLDDQVARVDGQSLTHCLGRFRVGGITNYNGNLDLAWKVNGAGLVTQLYYYDPFDENTRLVVLDAQDPASQPLPVDLVYFKGQSIDDEFVNLTWGTASELENDRFELERSYDALFWEKIATVKGRGNSIAFTRYSHADHDAFNEEHPVIYYRLKQIDWSGDINTFNDYVVIGGNGQDGLNAKGLHILPNVVTTGPLSYTLKGLAGSLNVRVSNAQGIIVHEEVITPSDELYQGQIFLTQDLIKGFYWLEISGADQTMTDKFLLER